MSDTPDFDAKLELRQETAYYDYSRMPDGKRSVDALWRSYCERKRAGDAMVPTTNRETIYRWAREKGWDERLLRERQELQEEEQKHVADIRKRQISQMTLMLTHANEALLQLIKDTGTDPAVRLRAVQTLYDRVGFPAESRIAANRRNLDNDAENQAPAADANPAPGPDATEEEWATYLRKRKN